MGHRQTRHTGEEKSSGVTLVAFCASWCVHCLYQRRAFERARAALGNKVAYDWIDIEATPGAVKGYAVEAIPMILVMRDGEEYLRLVGVQSDETIVEGVWASTAHPHG